MDLSKLLYKRILAVEKSGLYSSPQTVEEFKIIEISPSQDWVKIQNMNGRKFWKSVHDIKPIEVLSDLSTFSPEN